MPENEEPPAHDGKSRTSAPTRDAFALGFSIVLLFRIAGTIFLLAKYGRSVALNSQAPTLFDEASQNFTGALVLFLIGASNLPTLWRKSRFIRSQIQCWALWQVLLGIFLLTQSRLEIYQISLVAFYLFSISLAVCSVVMLYKPRDFFHIKVYRW
jgi:hypothetical protein